MHGFRTMFWNACKSSLCWDTWESTYNYMTASTVYCSPKGWTDGDVALSWKIKGFDEQTHDKAQGKTHVLILDGQGLHYMPELLEYAWGHDIMILGYPPHCTHAVGATLPHIMTPLPRA